LAWQLGLFAARAQLRWLQRNPCSIRRTAFINIMLEDITKPIDQSNQSF